MEDCDNTAGEVLVVTAFYLVGSIMSQHFYRKGILLGKIRICVRILFENLRLAPRAFTKSVSCFFKLKRSVHLSYIKKSLFSRSV